MRLGCLIPFKNKTKVKVQFTVGYYFNLLQVVPEGFPLGKGPFREPSMVYAQPTRTVPCLAQAVRALRVVYV